MTEASAEAQERDFLQALAAGRDGGLARVRIQDIERYAPAWASLVPSDAGTRVALARALAAKYRFTVGVAPRMRAALGLDEATLREFAIDRLSLGERAEWTRAGTSRWLEELPPFWTAFALTLTGTVGTTTLALPIAFAWLGPLGGILVLVVLGIANILTIAAMAEAMTRSGGMHYGSSYLGRLVREYLGGWGTVVFTVCSLAAVLFALLVRFVGFGTILEGGTGVVAPVWALALFGVNLWFLRRGRFDSTVAAALVIGAVNIALVLGLAALAVPVLVAGASATSASAPPTGGPSLVELAFGVGISVYARHISVGTTAKVVLPRDPGGRSLIAGNVAALGVAIVLYCAWVAAVNGVVPADVLAGTRGTAVEPYAAVAGSGAHLLGGAFAILSMGLGSISMSLVLFHTVHEWLPALGPRAGLRRAASLLPVFGIVGVAVWLLATDQEAFTAPIAFVGTITGPVLSGVFPMLLLVASRRAGEYVPAVVAGPLGRPVVAVALAALFLAALLIHVALWTDPIQRGVTVVAGLATLVIAARFVGRPPVPTLTVELRVDLRPPPTAWLTVTDVGRPASVAIRVVRSGEPTPVTAPAIHGLGVPLGPALGLDEVQIDIPATPEVRLWMHELTEDGRSRPRSVLCTLSGGERSPRQVGVGVSGRTSLVATHAGTLTIALTHTDAPP